MFDGDSDPDQVESALRAQLAAVDARVTPFRLRNRYRNGTGRWIVSIAVPAGHVCRREKLASAASELGMRVEGFFEYRGDLNSAIANDLGEPPMKDGLPLTNEDQFCAFCDDDCPVWVHPFDSNATAFEFDRDRFTLPGFWTVCESCEVLINEGRDLDLSRLYADRQGGSHDMANRVVEVFRIADLGPRPITPAPTPQ